jgi:hypothetical protein
MTPQTAMRQNLFGHTSLGTGQAPVYFVNGTPLRELADPPLQVIAQQKLMRAGVLGST